MLAFLTENTKKYVSGEMFMQLQLQFTGWRKLEYQRRKKPVLCGTYIIILTALILNLWVS